MTAPASGQLKITEIMYNPFATNEFEYVELYNTGATDVDLSGWVFARNLNHNPNLGGNVGSGVVPAGGTAVLIRTDGTPDVPRGGRMPEGYSVAWELQNNPDINLISVSNWPGLVNATAGTGLGLWSDANGYLQDVMTTFQDPSNPVFTYTHANYVMSYANGNGWPVTDDSNLDDGPSIYLQNIKADENNGAYWSLSETPFDSSYNGGTGSIAVTAGSLNIDRSNDVGSPGLLPLLGDFNRDGQRDAADIDLLLASETNSTPPLSVVFDVQTDGQINPSINGAASDADHWVRVLEQTEYGDANLDGKVDVADLGILASNWQTSGTWATADFDGSGLVDVADLGLLASNWQFGVSAGASADLAEALASAGLAGVSVPEPGTGMALLAVGALVVPRRRPRRRSEF
jgi:hypothetical protein